MFSFEIDVAADVAVRNVDVAVVAIQVKSLILQLKGVD